MIFLKSFLKRDLKILVSFEQSIEKPLSKIWILSGKNLEKSNLLFI